MSSINYALRCDAKLADASFRDLEKQISQDPFQELGDFLPNPFVQGIQADYLEESTEESIPVVNTLSIQNLSFHPESCRHIARDLFDKIDETKNSSLVTYC